MSHQLMVSWVILFTYAYRDATRIAYDYSEPQSSGKNTLWHTIGMVGL